MIYAIARVCVCIYVFLWDSLLDLCLFSACSLLVLCLFSACSLPFLCVSSACSLPVLCLFSACFRLVHGLFSSCSQPVLCSFSCFFLLVFCGFFVSSFALLLSRCLGVLPPPPLDGTFGNMLTTTFSIGTRFPFTC